ncbi:MAG: tryptophan synthase subunit alpha [Desulfobacterales bacterium]
MLDNDIRKRLEEKDILLMTHIVMGYPSFDDSLAVVSAMVNAGVDLMELQIPFSEPIADGPVILNANQKALANGTRVSACMAFARKVTELFDIPFLIMTYYNILFASGVDRFVSGLAAAGVKGAIVPDLPPEEADEYQTAMKNHQLAPIYIFSPTTPEKRMGFIDSRADGFIYCVARKGVTGEKTAFSEELADYLNACRRNTRLPLAVGFGVKDKTEVDFLRGKADIAVVGSEAIRVFDREGVDAVGAFIRSLR